MIHVIREVFFFHFLKEIIKFQDNDTRVINYQAPTGFSEIKKKKKKVWNFRSPHERIIHAKRYKALNQLDCFSWKAVISFNLLARNWIFFLHKSQLTIVECFFAQNTCSGSFICWLSSFIIENLQLFELLTSIFCPGCLINCKKHIN